jgi:hypothetical protein
MALTMTRTRTQTTLTKLAEMTANVHGELAFVEALLADGGGAGAGATAAGRSQAIKGLTLEVHSRIAARRQKLLDDRGALYATIRQFDASLEPENIGGAEGWRKRFGTRQLRAKTLTQRYLRAF